ncbi:MAG: divergent polysaccharide deacetylase family protein [Chromatiales bacterium]|jgi:polysaccharide deacetylase 2 family uncharacterized protein YibQ|nr:divergent polysaccharide deacetylase family protein [Chromatiales bacterium]
MSLRLRQLISREGQSGIIGLSLRFFLLLLFPVAHADEGVMPVVARTHAVIAIIIDDLGYHPELDRRVVRLPGAVTCAFLPHTPYAPQLADLADALGKEVMLHLPMESVEYMNNPGMLNVNMDRQSFARAVRDGLASVPHASGINNHMGSLLTQSPLRMQWLMDEIKLHRGIYFVDSYTSVQSVAWQIAAANRLPSARRDVFLDNNRDPAMIRAQFERLLASAWKNGYAIAIAHPYPETVAFLEAKLPALAGSGIELVPVSRLIERRTTITAQAVDTGPEENVALIPASATH